MKTQLCQSEIKEFIARIEAELGLKEIVSKKDIVITEPSNFAEDISLIKVNNKPVFFSYKNKISPTLKAILELMNKHGQRNVEWLKTTKLKTITVDKGAVKFVVNGADIMRPGITSIDYGFDKDSFVIIIDQEHKKPLAIGIALLNSEDMNSSAQGKVIKNIHYVGDEIWKMQ